MRRPLLLLSHAMSEPLSGGKPRSAWMTAQAAVRAEQMTRQNGAFEPEAEATSAIRSACPLAAIMLGRQSHPLLLRS